MEVFVNSPLNKVSQLDKALLKQYKIPLSIYREVIQGIFQAPGAGSVPQKGSPLVRALSCVRAKRLLLYFMCSFGGHHNPWSAKVKSAPNFAIYAISSAKYIVDFTILWALQVY